MAGIKSGSDIDWPEAVEVVNENGASDIVLLCEHASSHIPAEYADLGLDEADRFRHIAWDIGAAAVTMGLATQLDAPAFLCNYSRLLIDLNRPLEAPGSIPARSESTDIPGNVGITEIERQRRAELIFAPFHDRVAAHLTRREEMARPTRIVTIHSFTPVFFGEHRPWHVGVLYNKSRDFGEAVIRGLRHDTSLNIGANVPYVISRDEDYAIPVHGEDRNYEALLIEIRHDLIANDRGIEEMTKRLGNALIGAGSLALQN